MGRDVGAYAMVNTPGAWQEQLLERHRLDRSYLDHAQKWFAPLADAIGEHQKSAGRPLLVGINGSQGSGKTTLCEYLRARLQAAHGLAAVALSLDDFYHTRARREQLARQVHPLLMTRGVPGTHDTALLQHTLDLLLNPEHRGPVPIPRFDKALDDRRPREAWDEADPDTRVVLLEGWCLGARPQERAVLEEPVNDLERQEDPETVWRRYTNIALAREFGPLYHRVDRWIMLCAPSFDCVYHWRLEQEQTLAATVHAGAAGEARSRIMDPAEIARFVQFFQRLTTHCLETLPQRVDHLYMLDQDRGIVACKCLERETL